MPELETLIYFPRVYDVKFAIPCPRVNEGSCALCVGSLKPCIVELCCINHKIGKRIFFQMI